jgi:hypothetical protein
MLILLMIFRPTGILGSREAARQVLAKVVRQPAPKPEAPDA